MTRYFLGIDGGQSSTRAVIADELGRVLGSGRGGPCNHVTGPDGRAKFTNAIRASVGQAAAQARLNLAAIRFASLYGGFSGGPADKASLLSEIMPSDHVQVTDDSLIALSGATAGAPGVVVIAGTGSIAFGRNTHGRTARVGGWGYLFGDEGGAFWIFREALRAALAFEEGWGPPTSLRARLMDFALARDLRVKNIDDLMHCSYTPELARPRAASLSMLVNHAAEDADPAALEILDTAARELAALANAARGQLFAAGEPTLVSYWGGVFRSRGILTRFRNLLGSQAGVRVAAPVYEPVMGALIEAYRAVGLNPIQYPSA
jgi:N-acetylglucosamine kinase-like BadF-type ATPase